MKRVTRSLSAFAAEAWLPAALIAAWWFISAGSTSFYFPPLQEILARFKENWLFARVPTDLLPSLANLASGLVAAIVVGTVLGVFLGLRDRLEELVRPLLAFARALPPVALLPLLVVVVGIGPRMNILLIAFATVWPVLLNTIDGVRAIEPVVHDMRKVFGVRSRDSLLRVILPAASPQIVVGIRQALAGGVSVLIFSELVGATHGIGFFTLQAQRTLDVADMWSGMLLLGLLGYAINLGFRGLEHYLMAWHERRVVGSTAPIGSE